MIANSNSEDDVLFKYYDNRNKTRLTKLGNKAGITKDLTHSLKENGSSVLSILKKIKETGSEYAKRRIDDHKLDRRDLAMVCYNDINVSDNSDDDGHNGHRSKGNKNK